MNKQAYLNRCMGQDAEWLRASAANPAPGMSKMHIALQLIAARRKDRIRAYYAGVAAEEGWA